MDSWRTTYAGIIPDAYLASLSLNDEEAKWSERLRSGEAAAFVVESGSNEILGFASGGARAGHRFLEYGAELYAIYLLKLCQRSGLGKELFLRVAGATVDRGARAMLTWCLSKNPSRRFYEVLGGESMGTQSIEIGGVKLEETCYGWRDTRELWRRQAAEC